MAPQLYITMYREQFGSPGRAKRAQLRPTSAHRRNNPQPRPDFLFPRSLQPNYRSIRAPPAPPPLPPVDTGRPIFPPVRHLSFHSPVATCPDSSPNTVDAVKPQHMPPVNPSAQQALPSADSLQTLQLQNNPQRGMDYQRNAHPLSAQQLRQHAAAHLQRRPQTCNPPRPFSRRHQQSGCYSCFHVVKPYQAGHYIIHPEFVSECLY
ncbi:uncharacterized protein LOC125006580 isoform X2 [Mugil cephalus]|uniref:uncharacterized protein LOC125006580 isoform X2 n=1 Tax=Mugil cephalus TaxID=48193 RepID=UPI001FB7D6D7|nr:uncharacterized protein LOC125006580 isoform X2 [Mugil cephalus]